MSRSASTLWYRLASTTRNNLASYCNSLQVVATTRYNSAIVAPLVNTFCSALSTTTSVLTTVSTEIEVMHRRIQTIIHAPRAMYAMMLPFHVFVATHFRMVLAVRTYSVRMNVPLLPLDRRIASYRYVHAHYHRSHDGAAAPEGVSD